MKDLRCVFMLSLKNLKFGNLTLLFGRLRQRILLNCVPHVQHDDFALFNQSDHCFLASSLPLSACQDSCLSQVSKLMVSTREKILMNRNLGPVVQSPIKLILD